MRISNPHVVLLTLALAAFSAGCGGDGGFSEAAVPALSLNEPSSPIIQMELPNPPNRTAAQTAIKLKNEGDAPMKISTVEWVNRPERLIIRGDSTETSCEYNGDAPNLDDSGNCPDDTYCSWQTKKCVEIGGASPPITVDPGLVHVIDAVVMPGDDDSIECPDAPGGRNVPAGYCGELLIQTNAATNSGDIKNGDLRIFFTHLSGSGRIALEPGNLTFSGVERGESASRDLTIQNTHEDEPLTISEMRFREHGLLFSVSGDSTPTDIAPGSSKTWSIDFTAPDTDEWESDPAALGTELEILSSARNETSSPVPITVSKQVDLPAIAVEPSVLHFHEDTRQTFTVSNLGDASLTMQSLSIDPSTAASLYEFSIDGATFNSAIPQEHKVVRPGESVDIDVDFSDSGEDNTIATFTISYNYFVDGEGINDSAGGLLLGSVGDAAVGFVHPDTFSFSATDGHSASRTFVVRNVGTQPLDITGTTLNTNAGSAANFSVDNAQGQIPPGELKEMTLNYTGDSEMDNVLLDFESNSVGTDFSLFLVSDPSEPPTEIEAQITPGFGDHTTNLGAEASLSARQTTGADTEHIDRAEWVMLERPASSQVFLDKTGADVTFVPDVAGDYKVAVFVHNGTGIGSQETYSFEVVE